MTKLFTAAALTAALAGFAATGAHAAVVVPDCGCAADPLSGSFAVSIWSASTPYANANSSSQQALPSNSIITAGNKVGAGVYTGAMNFDYEPAGYVTPTVAGFFNTGSGTYTGTGGSAVLSGANYSRTTVIEFTFTTSKTLQNLTFSHDDGVSLFAAGNTSTDLLAMSAATPHASISATLSTLAPGTYNLWFAEVDGGLAELCVNDPSGGTVTVPPTNTPEPASLSLLGAGLAAIGFVRRRRAA
jgi:hypothetical protein